MPPELLTLPAPLAAALPPHHVEQYLGPWAMHEDHFRALCERYGSTDLVAHVEAAAGRSAGKASYSVEDGVALIEINGTMLKYGSSFSDSPSTVELRQQVRAAARDPKVSGILLLIDSPGGSVAGTGDLAHEIAAAAGAKPVHAYIEDLGASAAYWVASQASYITANRTAMVGSIGTYMQVVDSSAAAMQRGVKVHVIRAGEHKGAGAPGTEITESQRAEFQRTVDSLNAEFLAGVQSGRKLSADQVKTLADGRVHVGQSAVDLKLIDAVGTLDQAIERVSSLAKSSTSHDKKNPRSETMSTETEKPVAPQAATIQQIEAACPSAPGDFVLAQLKTGATLSQAQTAWCAKLSEENKALKAEVADLKAKAPKVEEKPAAGVKPLKNGVDATAPAADGDFNSMVAELVAKGMTKAKAIREITVKYPEVAKAAIEAANAR